MMSDSSLPATQPTYCNVCENQSAGQPIFAIAEFQFVKCPGCNVIRVNPRLDDKALQAYYDQAYWSSQDSVVRGYFDYAADVANIRKTFRRRIRTLNQAQAKRGRWLDVGCAAGFLVQEALAAGWDAFGIEWSDYIVQQAAKEIQSRISIGRLLDTKLAEKFDVITLWDYLEHSSHPRQDLEKAVQLLNPGGTLSIIIPDAGSWLAKWMGPRWEEYKKPQEHLYFFTAQQLQRLCRALGLSIERKTRAGKYASLSFAFSRFRPEDGILYWAARIAAFLLKGLGLSDQVVYINPRDKLHLICRKTRGIAV